MKSKKLLHVLLISTMLTGVDQVLVGVALAADTNTVNVPVTSGQHQTKREEIRAVPETGATYIATDSTSIGKDNTRANSSVHSSVYDVSDGIIIYTSPSSSTSTSSTSRINDPKSPATNIPYRIDHIPLDTPHERRPGNPMIPEYITIHNTANPRSTAKGERGWLTNPSNLNTASYHIVVDENEAIECIPLNENAWHAGDGDGDGNRRSIGIEITESGNYTKTLENAATLVANMLMERGWEVSRLRRHADWAKRTCPGKMYDNGTWAGWYAFTEDVKRRMQEQQSLIPNGSLEASSSSTGTPAMVNGHIVDNRD